MDLPGELRNQTYRYALVFDRPLHVFHPVLPECKYDKIIDVALLRAN